jgi:hypothetical protein
MALKSALKHPGPQKTCDDFNGACFSASGGCHNLKASFRFPKLVCAVRRFCIRDQVFSTLE